MSGNSIFRTALIDRAQKGIFSDEVTKSTFEDSLLALGELAAKCRDDETLDKWLYRAIGRAAQLDQFLIHQTALALVDVLRVRLKCRKNPASFAAMALGAGAGVNATRLELRRLIATPSTEFGQTLLARGVWALAAIDGLLQLMARHEFERYSISPKEYTDSLRSSLRAGASVLEATSSPTLAHVAWACRCLAVEALITTNPRDIDSLTREALHGLSAHCKQAPTATVFRLEWLASLEVRIRPWLAAPPMRFEWYVRRAAILVAAGDEYGAAAARLRGRLHVGRLCPLYSGILYCGDIQSGDNPPWPLKAAVACFQSSLRDNVAADSHRNGVWYRGWMALAFTSASFGQLTEVVLTLADIATCCVVTHKTNTDCADVVKCHGLAESRAVGLMKSGLAALAWAKSCGDLRFAAFLFECAITLPKNRSLSWTELAGCLAQLGRNVDAASAAAEACCHCFHADIHGAVAGYSQYMMYMGRKAPSLLMLLQEAAATSDVQGVLREWLRACQAGNNVSVLINAAEELAVSAIEAFSSPAAFAMAHAGIALMSRGAHCPAYVLSSNGLKAAHDSVCSVIAYCSLAMATNPWHDVSHKNTIAEASALAALLGICETTLYRSLVYAEPLVAAVLALRNKFSYIGDFVGEFRTCEALVVLLPQLRHSVMASFLAILACSGFVDLALALSGDVKTKRLADVDLNLVETQLYALFGQNSYGCVNSGLLVVAFDEARAVSHARAMDIGVQVCGVFMNRGDLSEATRIALLVESMMRFPWHHKQGVLFSTSTQTKVITTKGALCSLLPDLWLRQGSSSCARKYLCHENVSTQAAISRTMTAVKVSSCMRDWHRAEAYLKGHGNYADISSYIRSLEQALGEGDLLHRQGNLLGATVCYEGAKYILDGARGYFSEALVDSKSTATNIAASKSKYYQPLLLRATRIADLCCEGESCHHSYRAVLRSQPSSMMDRAWLRYRLGRALFKQALITKAAAPAALNMLCHSFLAALHANQWKLVKNSAQVLAVVALHFLPGAVSSPIVALLAHVSVGRRASQLCAGSVEIDALLTDYLCVCNAAEGRGWRHDEVAKLGDITALDKLLMPLPETYSIVAAFIAPTGHLVFARIQRGRTPITLCVRSPGGWHIINRCRGILRMSSLNLLASAINSRVMHPRFSETATRRHWWCQRLALDSALRANLEVFDKACVGALRVLLATAPADSLDMSFRRDEILRLCICAAPHLNSSETRGLVCTRSGGVVAAAKGSVKSQNNKKPALQFWLAVVNSLHVTDLKDALAKLGIVSVGLKAQLSRILSRMLENASFALDYEPKCAYKSTGRQPLILALGKDLQLLPIEDLAVTRLTPISRVPSLAVALSLATQMRPITAKRSARVQPMRACYVVDPEANLPATCNTLHEYFKKNTEANDILKWSCAALGGTSKPDIAVRLAVCMPSCVAYLFCGHGHGATYLASAIEETSMAAVLLMGCSSGSLTEEGDVESRGVAIELLAKGVPVVIGMLWDVTDRDVDCITLELLKLMAKQPNGLIPDLICAARQEAKLRTLNGSSIACYGLPISLAQIQSAHTPRTISSSDSRVPASADRVPASTERSVSRGEQGGVTVHPPVGTHPKPNPWV